MNILSTLILNFGENTDTFYSLLLEEDFDFKTKNININFLKNNDKIEINFQVSKILDLKIASSAVIKSLEVIDKTMQIDKINSNIVNV